MGPCYRSLLGMFGISLALPALALAAPLGGDAVESAGVTTAPGAYTPAAPDPAVPTAVSMAPAAGGSPTNTGKLELEHETAAPSQAYPPVQTRVHSQAQPHRHRTLFGRRHCVECQRAYVKARDGVDIPAPPPIASGEMINGQIVTERVVSETSPTCATCQGQAVVTGPIASGSEPASYTIVGGPGVMAGASAPAGYAVVGGSAGMANAGAPGYAVVGGPGTMVASGAPGYAVVNETIAGQEPAPIGVSRSALGQPGAYGMAAVAGRQGPAGSFDASVAHTSIPRAPAPQQNPEHESRYKIIAHAIGVPKFGSWRRAEEQKERQKHAAITYDDANSKVTELPASMVYGKGDH